MPAPFTRDRAAMEKHIREGGSVLLPDGRNVARVEDLPDESTLAGVDVDRHQSEVDRLQLEHDQLGVRLKAAQGKLADARKVQGQAQQTNPPKGQQAGQQANQAGQADAGQGTEQATDAGAEPPRGHAGHHGRK